MDFRITYSDGEIFNLFTTITVTQSSPIIVYTTESRFVLYPNRKKAPIFSFHRSNLQHTIIKIETVYANKWLDVPLGEWPYPFHADLT